MRARLNPFLPVLACVALALWSGPGWAAAAEADLKAAFIFNFAKFVEWPDDHAAGSQAELNLCLIGEGDRTFEALREKDGQPARNRTLRVRVASPGGNLRACHILVVAESEMDNFEAILRRLEGVPVLTVNGSTRFLDAGGVIGLFPDGGKMRFDINLAAARRNNLVLSSNLLKLARTVRQ